jgi:hypothetical protein
VEQYPDSPAAEDDGEDAEFGNKKTWKIPMQKQFFPGF